MIRAVRCSCVIRPSFARHAPRDRLEHREAGAPPADFDVSFPRRLVDVDDQALLSAGDGLGAQGAAARDRDRERGVLRLNRRRSV
jgi:hypothetical protein